MSERFGVDVRRRGKENKMSYAFEDKDEELREVPALVRSMAMKGIFDVDCWE